MKFRLLHIILLLTWGCITAQIETSNSLRIDQNNNFSTDNYKLPETPDLKANSDLYSLPEALEDYNDRQNNKTFSMIGDNGLLKPTAEATPKWFKKDKEIKEEYKSDQYFGDFKSGGKFVQLIYRDHEYVDGDIVRILVNDDVILSNVYLSGSFQGIKIDLIKGFNKIDIQALNQGESGPNTAEFHLYDDQGVLLTGNEWNLTTGVKATLIIVKDE